MTHHIKRSHKKTSLSTVNAKSHLGILTQVLLERKQEERKSKEREGQTGRRI